MEINTRKINLYTQVQRLAARVLFIVGLLGSCGPQSALANFESQRTLGPVKALVWLLALFGQGVRSLGPLAELDNAMMCPDDSGFCTPDTNPGVDPTRRTGLELLQISTYSREECENYFSRVDNSKVWKDIVDSYDECNSDSKKSICVDLKAVRLVQYHSRLVAVDTGERFTEHLIHCIINNFGETLYKLSIINSVDGNLYMDDLLCTYFAEFQKLTSLRELYLINDGLSGCPTYLLVLPALTYANLSQNKICGNIEFYSETFKANNITVDCSNHELLTCDKIPSWKVEES